MPLCAGPLCGAARASPFETLAPQAPQGEALLYPHAEEAAQRPSRSMATVSRRLAALPDDAEDLALRVGDVRSDDHTSELHSLLRFSYALFFLQYHLFFLSFLLLLLL